MLVEALCLRTEGDLGGRRLRAKETVRGRDIRIIMWRRIEGMQIGGDTRRRKSETGNTFLLHL